MVNINLLTPGFTSPNGCAFLFPLIYHEDLLRDSGINLRLFSKFSSNLFDADIIAVDSKFHKYMWENQKEEIFSQFLKLKKKCNKLIYFDTTDSSGNLQSDLFDYVDVYCKGQVLKNKEKYLESFYGNRIYTDFAHKKYKVNDKVPEYSLKIKKKTDLKKIKLSWNTGLADYSVFGPFYMSTFKYLPLKILLNYKNISLRKKKKNILVRFGSSYSKETVSWQRKKILEIFKKNDNSKITRMSYYSELLDSKIIVSPFGWGEISLRDFEGFLSQTLLLKPNMDHLETWPNFFIKNKTYKAFSWNLNNLKDLINNLLENPLVIDEISSLGRENYLRYIGKDGETKFISQIQKIIY